MIVPGIGISTSIPNSYKELIRRLRLLGIAPTGNPIVDKNKLINAIEKRIEKSEEEKKEEKHIKKQMEEQKLGATQQGMLNRILHNI